jgi:hypothetical protein
MLARAPHALAVAHDDNVLEGRERFIAWRLLEAYSAGRADERRRRRAVEEAGDTIRQLYTALMAEAIGGSR